MATPAYMRNATLKVEKAAKLMEIEGFEDELEFGQHCMDGAPGSPNAICMNQGCDYTTEMENDQDRGWCDECGTNSMVSFLRLKDLI